MVEPEARETVAVGGPAGFTRRRILGALTAAGIATATFRRALAQQAAQEQAITSEMIQQAEWIADLELTDEEREATARSLRFAQRGAEQLRAVELDNSVPPAVQFDATPELKSLPEDQRGVVSPAEAQAATRPSGDEAIAFLPVSELAALIRSRQISSVELTKIYLERLHKYNSLLNCVVTFMDDHALKQARRADREMAAGRYRGVLHGIPWGAKDLIAYPGYKTTWGAAAYREQSLPTKATVAQRLDDAGAVLVAKLTLGAIAMGDQWFGGRTNSPWNPERGSSGSSAGSASATAAGLVAFALGSETLGSIVSPSRRCGNSSLRPTFGRVSRHGCMTLCWSMDKIGPLCRSIEDCALVLGAIHGADGLDSTAKTRPFHWPGTRDIRQMRIGYFEGDSDAGDAEPEAYVQTLKELGATLVPIQLPEEYPVSALRVILSVESATAFDQLLREGNMEGLGAWARTWNSGQLATGVDYLRANRVRTLVMHKLQAAMQQVDCYVGGNDLVMTNLTGQPTAVLPNGFRERNGVREPESLTFTGQLFGETELLTVAKAYQEATGHHLEHPTLTAPPQQQGDEESNAVKIP